MPFALLLFVVLALVVLLLLFLPFVAVVGALDRNASVSLCIPAGAVAVLDDPPAMRLCLRPWG